MPSRSRFPFALASTILVVHQSHPSSPVRVSSSSWDHLSQQFSPVLHFDLPLSGVPELLAAGVAYNSLFGESLPHVVIRRGTVLMIGCFDVDPFCFQVLVEVELPAEEFPSGGINPLATVEDCWLTDGPVFVAQRGRKFLTVHTLACQKSEFLDTSENADHSQERLWNASVLNLEGVGGNERVRALYCGDLKGFAGPDMLLGIQLSPEADFGAASSDRLKAGWNFVRLPVSSNFEGKINQKCSQNLIWQQIPLQNGLKVCNQLFPPEICPEAITCIEIIPEDPVTTVSPLLISPYEDAKSEDVFCDIAAGFGDGKLVKYKFGKVVAENEFEDALISLKFAIVAGSQGVLLAIFNGIEKKIAALCAETLQVLQAWTGGQDAVVGDFLMIGHDQLLLLSSTLETNPSPTSSDDICLKNVQLTDLEKDFVSGFQPVSKLDVAGGACEAHKLICLTAIYDRLQSRVEAGWKQMKWLEEQKVTKAKLVQSSCKLLQDMVVRHESVTAGDQLSGLTGNSGFLQASVRQQGTCGRTWFIVVDIQNISEEGMVIYDLSLSLTTVTGTISGSSSVMKLLCAGDERKRLVAAASLMNLPVSLKPLTIHIILMGKFPRCNSGQPAGCGEETAEGNFWMHSEWIGQVEVHSAHLTACLDPATVPLDFREVAPRHTFVIRAISEVQNMAVVDVMKSILKMEERKISQQNNFHAGYNYEFYMDRGRIYELVASHGLLWADTTIISLGKIHAVTLRAEDSKHLAVLKASFMTQLEREFDLLTVAAYPETINAAFNFSEVFKKELMHKKSLLTSRDPYFLRQEQKEGCEMESLNSSIWDECQLQMSTDRCFFRLFTCLL